VSMCPSGYGSERGMMSRNEGGGEGDVDSFGYYFVSYLV
jgi:hypothetical protein